MEDACGKHRVGADSDGIGEVLRVACAAGGDDGDLDGGRDECEQIEVVPVAGAVAIE